MTPEYVLEASPVYDLVEVLLFLRDTRLLLQYKYTKHPHQSTIPLRIDRPNPRLLRVVHKCRSTRHAAD